MRISWKNKEQEWRKQLLSYAKGNVLEVGAGEGVNFKYYPLGVSVIATDMSERMIEYARREARLRGVKTSFIVSRVEELSLEQQRFDTIISTFSLSAFENPGEVLDRFNDWCKPGGMILLLEYGLSRNGLVSWLQKKWQPFHYKRTGSHIDRDILSLITRSNLDVKKAETKYMGIVYLVWASLKTEMEK